MWDWVKNIYKATAVALFPGSYSLIYGNPFSKSAHITETINKPNASGSGISTKGLVLFGLIIVSALVLLKFLNVFSITKLFNFKKRR